MRCGPACILFFAVLASCANPPDMVNDPPVASFNDLQVSGAGTPAVDGYYRENGANELRPKYDKVGGGYFLYYLTPADLAGEYWSIQTAVVGTILQASSMYYISLASAKTTPEGTWSLGISGADPAPVTQRVAITGTLTEGQELTGHYLYSDPDGDAEDVAATTLQWYSFDSATETDTAAGTAIPGATAPTYILVAADIGKFLRLQVTPVDVLGLAGSPLLSGAVQIPTP
jgi:hypothetical protein